MREIVVILENVRSALNVGSIFRSCNGAGVSKLILCGITPSPPHPKIMKTALGTEKSVNFELSKDIFSVIQNLKQNGFEIVALEENSRSENYYNHGFGNKVALIFGHEITGVSIETMNNSDNILKLPMLGEKNSLNVANSVAIVLYDLTFRLTV